MRAMPGYIATPGSQHISSSSSARSFCNFRGSARKVRPYHEDYEGYGNTNGAMALLAKGSTSNLILFW
jgi:hypothetical protein